MIHKHHVTPVHKGGINGPVVELNPYEHAEIHAIRFINGDDDWFHGNFLQFLTEELQNKVKQRYSEVGSGEGHRNFGKSIWNNGEQIVYSKECPGPEFELGFPDSYKQNMSQSIKGQVFWNNETDQIRSKTCPGPKWKRGRLPWKVEHKKSFGNTTRGSRWWTNGETTKRSISKPGPNWRLGRG